MILHNGLLVLCNFIPASVLLVLAQYTLQNGKCRWITGTSYRMPIRRICKFVKIGEDVYKSLGVEQLVPKADLWEISHASLYGRACFHIYQRIHSFHSLLSFQPFYQNCCCLYKWAKQEAESLAPTLQQGAVSEQLSWMGPPWWTQQEWTADNCDLAVSSRQLASLGRFESHVCFLRLIETKENVSNAATRPLECSVWIALVRWLLRIR